MPELLYPLYPVPGFKDDVLDLDSEMFPIVEPDGRVVARATRVWCHSGSKLLHPVVHLHIVNRDGCIFLQRRSAKKNFLPLYWDTAVGGHVTYGETVEETLFRETSEELGPFDFNPIFMTSYVFESSRERELVNVFATLGNFDLHPHNDEVLEGRYWSFEELEASKGKGILTPNFEQEFEMLGDQLLKLL